MVLRLKKVRDGVVLSCTRAAGDAAIQRTGHGGFFALHDLMHYAVETVLGYRQAFLGLMESGWSFENFTRHGDPSYRQLPPEALLAEQLVGILSMHLHDGVTLDPPVIELLTAEINTELAAALAPNHRDGGGESRTLAVPPPTLTGEQIGAIYRRFKDLARRWEQVAVGEHLELAFPPGCTAASGPGTVSP